MNPCLRGAEDILRRLDSSSFKVKPDLQCQGIGKRAILLCEKEFSDAVKFYVDFPKELEKNRKCYENAGFYDSGKELEAEPDLVLVAYEKDAAPLDD